MLGFVERLTHAPTEDRMSEMSQPTDRATSRVSYSRTIAQLAIALRYGPIAAFPSGKLRRVSTASFNTARIKSCPVTESRATKATMTSRPPSPNNQYSSGMRYRGAEKPPTLQPVGLTVMDSHSAARSTRACNSSGRRLAASNRHFARASRSSCDLVATTSLLTTQRML